MADPQDVDVNGLFKAMIMSDVKNTALFGNNFLQTLDRATLLAIPRSALPGTIAGLSTASHVPESNPYAAAK